MKKNMGTVDKSMRMVAVASIVVVYFAGIITGPTAMALGIVAVIFAITSFIGFCPMYSIIGVNTCGEGSCCGGSCHTDKKDDKDSDEKSE